MSKKSKQNTHPKMELFGHDGNIFAILGRASRLLRENGQRDQSKEMCERVYGCHSYDDALFIISEYVETELSDPDHAKTLGCVCRHLQHGVFCAAAGIWRPFCVCLCRCPMCAFCTDGAWNNRDSMMGGTP